MNANVTINDQHGWNGNGAINVPIIEDKFAVRLAGVVAQGRGSDVRDIVNTTQPSDKTQGIRASAKADPFDGLLDLDFTYQNVSRKTVQFDQVESANLRFSGFGASPVTIRAKDRLSAVGTPRTNDLEFTTYDAQGRLHLAGQTLTYLYGRATQHLLVFAPTDIAGVFATDAAGGNQFGQPTDSRSKNSSHEIRLQNEERLFGMFDYVVGGLFAKGSSDTLFKSVTGIALAAPFANPPRLAAVVLTPIQRFGTNKETSFFANLTAHIGDATELSGGVRRIKYQDSSGLAISGVVNPLFSRDFTEKKTIYQASVKHNFTDDLMVYASTGSSFRPSTVAIGGPTGGLSALQASYLSTGPETSKSYEVGIKSDWFDKTLKVNITGFYQKFKNYPYRSSSGVYAIDRSNGANQVLAFNYVAGVPVTVKGVEGEVAFAPSSQFNIGANVSYSQGKIKNGTVACLDLNKDGNPDVVSTAPTLAQLEAAVGSTNISSCQVGFNANLSPRWSGTVQSEYNMPIGNIGEGYVRGLFAWKGKSQNDPVNTFDDVKSYGILNLFAGVRDADGRWEVGLYGKNVTNTFRVLTRSNGLATTPLRGGVPLGGPVTSSGPLSTTNYFAGPNGQGGLTVTEPREFGINLRLAIGSR
jgi:iron complex outermembrane receptor protein